jgi:endonuclease/exonuclease/phosphatase family metal-dependent hydrolase
MSAKRLKTTKKIGGLLLLLMAVCSSEAQSTYMYFQNNTELSLNVSATQFGSHAMDPGEWESNTTSIQPWQLSEEALRTNRESGVHNGTDFFFDVVVSHGTDTVVLQLKLTGNFIGSDMWHSAKGSGFDHPWRGDGSFYEQDLTFAGRDMTLKYQSALSGLYDDVTYVLHEKEPYPLDASDLTQPNILNVMSYNIYCLTPPISVTDQDERCRHIVDVCADYDAVLIQEAFDNDSRVNELIPNMSTVFPHYTAILDTANALEDGGIMIFSRWPILTEEQYYFDACEGSDCLANKGVMYAKIEKLGSPYHLFATHTQAFTSTAEVLSRMAQLREIRSFVQSRGIPANEPIIIGGDLNVDMHVNNMSEYDSLLSILNIQEPAYLGHPNTFDPAVNYYASGTAEYLDYICAVPNAAFSVSTTNEPLIERSIEDAMWGHFDLSDHFAIHGRLVYAPAANVGEQEQEIIVSFPNPTNGVLRFSQRLDELSLITMDGKLADQKTNVSEIELNELANGFYLVRYRFKGETGVMKVLKN